MSKKPEYIFTKAIESKLKGFKSYLQGLDRARTPYARNRTTQGIF